MSNPVQLVAHRAIFGCRAWIVSLQGAKKVVPGIRAHIGFLEKENGLDWRWSIPVGSPFLDPIVSVSGERTGFSPTREAAALALAAACGIPNAIHPKVWP